MAADKEPRLLMHVVEDELNLHEEYQIVADQLGLELNFHSGVRDFLALGEYPRPSCLVLELRVGDESGEDLQMELIQRGITVPIIFNTQFADVESAVRVMERGAITVLQKPTSTERLMQYVQTAIERDRNQLNFDRLHHEIETVLGELSERQRRILDYVVEGMSTKVIARRLDVSNRLVEKERSEILRTFDAASTPNVTLRVGQFLILDEIHQQSVPLRKHRPVEEKRSANPRSTGEE